MSERFPGGARVSGAVLPFGVKKDDPSIVIVQFKVCTEDLELRQAAFQALMPQLQALRVGDRRVLPILTDEDTRMTEIDARQIAQLVAPIVLHSLMPSHPAVGK